MNGSSHHPEVDNSASSMLLAACSPPQHGVLHSWHSAFFNALVEKDPRESVQVMRRVRTVLEDRLAELAFAESTYAAEHLDLCARLTYLRLLLKGASKEEGEIAWD